MQNKHSSTPTSHPTSDFFLSNFMIILGAQRRPLFLKFERFCDKKYIILYFCWFWQTRINQGEFPCSQALPHHHVSDVMVNIDRCYCFQKLRVMHIIRLGNFNIFVIFFSVLTVCYLETFSVGRSIDLIAIAG